MMNKIRSSPGIVDEFPLKDKVALLLDGTSTAGHALAMSLAEHGADIAIVYQQTRARRARKVKQAVEAAGRRCFIMPSQTSDETFAKKVIQQTINKLGRLDIFVDYSSLSDDQSM